MVDSDQREAIELIARIARDTGLSPTEIARRTGVAPSTLTRLYPVPTVKSTLSARTIAKLRSAFPQEPAYAETSHRVAEPRASYFGAPRGEEIPLYLLSPAPAGSARPEGTEGIALFEGDLNNPAGTAPIHIATSRAGRYFAVYMPGESMEPRFRSGEVLLLDRVKPPGTQSDVLLEFAPVEGRGLFTIASLADRDRSHLKLVQHRYQGKATVHRRDVARIFTIAGLFED